MVNPFRRFHHDRMHIDDYVECPIQWKITTPLDKFPVSIGDKTFDTMVDTGVSDGLWISVSDSTRAHYPHHQ